MMMKLIVTFLTRQLPKLRLLRHPKDHQVSLPMKIIWCPTRKYLFLHILLDFSVVHSWCDQCFFIRSNGGTDHPPSKKAKISSKRTVSTKEVVPLSSEEVPIVPPPPKRALRKQKENPPPITPSAEAPIPSSSNGHVSAVVYFLFLSNSPYPSSPRAYGWLVAAEYWLWCSCNLF